jgi:hypothetical protein
MSFSWLALSFVCLPGCRLWFAAWFAFLARDPVPDVAGNGLSGFGATKYPPAEYPSTNIRSRIFACEYPSTSITVTDILKTRRTRRSL